MSCPRDENISAGKINNRPYLPVINYRIARYGTFRSAMLRAIDSKLPAWTSREKDDYGIALIEMWAYLADILAYYQERIANEAYIRTAVLRESVIALTDFVDYRLAPGVAATTYIAMIADKEGVVPRGFRVESSLAGEPSKMFQTEEAVKIYNELNILKHVSDRQFRQLINTAKQLLLEGINLDLKVGDRILILDDEREKWDANPSKECEKWELRQLTEVTEKEDKTTLVKWSEQIWKDYDTHPKVFVFREKAMPFGNNAPDFRMLTKEQKDVIINDADKKNLDYLKGTAPNYTIYLDSVYENVKVGSYIAAVKPNDVELYRVKKVNEIVKVDFGLSSKVTVATVDTDLHMENFALRETTLLCDNEPLAHVTKETDPTPTMPGELEIEGIFKSLNPGSYIAISGEDAKGNPRSEVRRIASIMPGKGTTTIRLDRALESSYKKNSAIIYGNVVPASFGEPVKNEILGSGDASLSFQKFNIRKNPVTFLPDPEALHGASSSLELFVNDVLWDERDSFLDSGPMDRHYITEINEKDEMTITFGDGTGGAKPPTARDNITARYRKGVGGNTSTGTITGMVDSSLYLKSVLNPVNASGGAGRESEDNAKENAPLMMRTFDRAVSLEDYAFLARSFSGIAKSKAFWQWEGEEQAVWLIVSMENGKILDSEVKKRLRAFLDMRRDTNQKLKIENYKPMNIELEMEITVKKTHFNTKVKAEVEKALGNERNEDGSFNFFAFERLDFGMSIHLSDIYAKVDGIEGIEHFVITTFRRNGATKDIEEHIWIKNTQIAFLGFLKIVAKNGIE